MSIKLSKHLSTFLLNMFAVLSTACSPVKLLNSVIPTDGYDLKEDIAYGELARQKLDIYIPKETSTQKMPIVLFYYGGGWDSGKKTDYLFAAEAFTSKGYVTVIPDYRVFPEVKFPEFMQDPVSAAKWVKTHINEYGGDSDNVFIVGHSAGAHIGMMMNINTQYLQTVDLSPNDFNAFVGLAGPYDFLPLVSQRLKDIFGPKQSRWRSQPINFVIGDNQPILLMVGLKDNTVWPRNTFNLAKAIEGKKGSVQVIEFANYSHVDMVAKMAKPFRDNNDLLDNIVQFMQENTKTNQ